MPNKQAEKLQTILFAVNPISGDIDKNDLEEGIKKHSQQHRYAFEIFFTDGENDADKLAALIKKTNPSKVVAAGGDGTCNLVGKLLLKRDILMGIIPVGSANGMAKELQIPLQVGDALDVLVKGKIETVDTVILNKEHLSLHLSDIGMNAKIIERFEKESGRGIWGYAKSFFKEVGEARLSSFELVCDQKTVVKNAYMVVIANASKYGTGAVINPKGKISDGFFEVIFVRPYSTWHMLKMIIPFYTRKIHTLAYIDTFTCKNAVIRNFQKQAVQVDGEIIGRPEEVFVEIIPQSLKILVPAD